MSGWPNRASRSSFGQQYEDSTPVRDPRKQIGAQQMNLDFWQVAGMGRVSPRAFLHFTGAASPVILNRGEAWNPDALSTGQYAPPTSSSVGNAAANRNDCVTSSPSSSGTGEGYSIR